MNHTSNMLRSSFTLFTFIALTQLAPGQGTFLRTVTFDRNPIPPSSDIGVTYYYEQNLAFTPINSGDQFGRHGGNRDGWPYNGTSYLIQGRFDSLAVGCDTTGPNSRFGLYSVDLSEFSTLYQFPWTIQFVGYRYDGSVVTTEFTTDGIIDGTGPLADFQTFYFDKEFSDLVRFEVPSYGYALDNLVFFDVIPEPAAGSLLFLGCGLLGLRILKRKSRPTG